MQICKFQPTVFAQIVISGRGRVVTRLWYLGKLSLGLKNSKCALRTPRNVKLYQKNSKSLHFSKTPMFLCPVNREFFFFQTNRTCSQCFLIFVSLLRTKDMSDNFRCPKIIVESFF